MSYINDALRKVQKEKESGYASYSDIVFAEGRKPDARRKWLSIIGILIVFCFASVLIASLYWQEMNHAPRAITVVPSPPVALVPSSPDAAIGAAPPATAQETPTASIATSPDVAAPPSADVKPSPAVSESFPAAIKTKKQDARIPTGGKNEDVSGKAPVNPRILYRQALQRQNEGKLEEAKALYQKVITADPRHASALNNLGVIFMNQKMYKQAVNNFNEAINIRHNYVDAHYNLACLYAQKNDIKQSLFYLKNAMDLSPEVRQWAIEDKDLKVLSDLPEFNKLVQAQDNGNGMH